MNSYPNRRSTPNLKEQTLTDLSLRHHHHHRSPLSLLVFDSLSSDSHLLLSSKCAHLSAGCLAALFSVSEHERSGFKEEREKVVEMWKEVGLKDEVQHGLHVDKKKKIMEILSPISKKNKKNPYLFSCIFFLFL
ncbi:hypothetical protein Dsin_001437 [Dipteronia sinensis]|uniref:Uncharacterized protein n=1 Tax=Dipteronia sinensis TaxID=43782 RepID=A0AAE0B3W3_9ROSI|nr:hypothetical protein Dsin_001437 [Dipteronia sinensis]